MLWGFDPLYFILVIPCIIISVIAQYKVKSTYKKYSQVRNTRGLTGAQAAQEILAYYGITDVAIQMIGGTLTDNFNPKTRVISLSEGVYNSTSIAAVGVACHEAGHAAQYAENYAPIKLRNTIIPICNIGSTISIPLILIGFFLASRVASFFSILITIGILLYATVFIFQLVTLPVEFNASRRAIKVISEMNLLYDEEVSGAKKVLSAAAMTYVAAMLVSLANLLRIMIRFSGRRN